MYDPSRVKFPFASLTNQLEQLLQIKQEEEEGLMEHVKQFMQT